jgi:U4/U6.U5 tri-snRNP-associated protein 1
MTPKEAWKSLSHKFQYVVAMLLPRFDRTLTQVLIPYSGKTSGRMKTELRLRRIEEERKAMAMGASDTPSGMLQAFSRRQEATGEAYMTLSVGNRS